MPSRPRPTPAVRVPPTFEVEYPTASRLATEVFLNIGVLAGAVRGAVEALVADEGLPSMAAFNILSVLGGDPEPLRPSEIAARMMVTRATITGVLGSLEARHLIRRRANAQDRRSVEISLSAAGRRVVERLVPRMHEFERELMGVLTDPQLSDLLDSVAELQEHLKTLAPDAHLGIR